MATIVKTQAGSFKAIIRKDGRIIKTKTFKLKKNARTWAVRVEGDKDALAAFGSKGATILFKDLAGEYLREWKGSGIDAHVDLWVAALGHLKLIDITDEHIREVLDRYAEGEALRGNGCSAPGKIKVVGAGRKRAPATVNRFRARISAMFTWAMKKKGYIKANPALLVPHRAENNQRVRYLDNDERRRLLEASKASSWDKLYLLVVLALTTGARQGELLNLRWSDIDFSARTALLRQTKNGEPRVLTFPPQAIEQLRTFREVGSRLVFPSLIKFDRPFEFRKHWDVALKRANIENFRFHDLRHSAASYLVMNGATLEETAQVLGHKSVQTTKRYAHISVEHKRDLTDRIMGGMEL